MDKIRNRKPWKELSRRGFLAGSAAVVSAGGSMFARAGACILAAEQEQGPYYVNREIVRKNIAEDRKGLPLKLQVSVVDSSSCSPIHGAAVDIWHCDASGEYSGFAANGPGGGPPLGGMRRPSDGMGPPPGMDGFGPDGDDYPHGPPPGGMGPTNKKIFLRGVQLTDQSGCAEFVTIYPGWYVGRSIHIHLKVHIAGHEQAGNYAGGHVSHTGQLFFPEDVSNMVAGLDPYVRHHAPRTLHSQDHVFLDQHGPTSIVDLRRVREHSLAQGLVAIALVGVDPKATPGGVGFGGPGR